MHRLIEVGIKEAEVVARSSDGVEESVEHGVDCLVPRAAAIRKLEIATVPLQSAASVANGRQWAIRDSSYDGSRHLR